MRYLISYLFLLCGISSFGESNSGENVPGYILSSESITEIEQKIFSYLNIKKNIKVKKEPLSPTGPKVLVCNVNFPQKDKQTYAITVSRVTDNESKTQGLVVDIIMAKRLSGQYVNDQNKNKVLQFTNQWMVDHWAPRTIYIDGNCLVFRSFIVSNNYSVSSVKNVYINLISTALDWHLFYTSAIQVFPNLIQCSTVEREKN